MTLSWKTKKNAQDTGLNLRFVSNDKILGQSTKPHVKNY